MSFIRVFLLIHCTVLSEDSNSPTMVPTGSTDLPTISTDLPTIQPTDLPSISPITIQPTDLPSISPVTIICPPGEDERIFRIHLEIPKKQCPNTPFEEKVDLNKNILEQIADISEPESFCVDLEIINIQCGSYGTNYGFRLTRRRLQYRQPYGRGRRLQLLTISDVIDEAVANINAAVGTTGTIMFEGELLSFTVFSNEELNDEKQLSDSSGDSSGDSSSDSFDGMDVELQSGYNSINNMEQLENVTHGVNNVLIELNVWNYVLVFAVLEICIICFWYTKCKRY